MTITQSNPAITNTINRSNWQEKKNKLRAKYPNLQVPDVDYEEGKVEEMIEEIHDKIGKIIGKSKEGLHQFIEQL